MNPFVFIIAVFALLGLSVGDFPTSNNSDMLWYSEQSPVLEEGDLVFRRGKSIESYAVLAADGSTRYSHVGIVHRTSEGKLMVVHAVPAEDRINNRVKSESLAQFWSYDHASAGAIYRFQINPSQKQIIHNYLERTYQLAVSFDDAYDLFDSTKLYCTELIYNAFDQCNVDITAGHIDTLLFPRRIPIIFPSTILKNTDLTQIYSYPHN